MTKTKEPKNQSVNEVELIRQYTEILKQDTGVVRPRYSPSNLKQPSLLEDVDSVTTYEVNAIFKEFK